MLELLEFVLEVFELLLVVLAELGAVVVLVEFDVLDVLEELVVPELLEEPELLAGFDVVVLV